MMGKSIQVPSVTRVKRSMTHSGDGVAAKLYNGRNVTWKRLVIPAGEVDKTIVFMDNERVQDLLTKESVSDITTSMSRMGPDKAAVGRMVGGIVEIADGSRRRFAAIDEFTPYPIDVTDLTDEEMLHLSLTGNIYRKPSAYEIGQRYLNLKESLLLNNTKLVEYLASKGEHVSRRNVGRFIATANLPIEVIQAFEIANDCTAEMGEKLLKVLENEELSEENEGIVKRAAKIRAEKNKRDAKDVFSTLICQIYDAKDKDSKVEMLHHHASVKTMKNGMVSIELSPDINPISLKEIKQFIEMTLQD